MVESLCSFDASPKSTIRKSRNSQILSVLTGLRGKIDRYFSDLDATVYMSERNSTEIVKKLCMAIDLYLQIEEKYFYKFLNPAKAKDHLHFRQVKELKIMTMKLLGESERTSLIHSRVRILRAYFNTHTKAERSSVLNLLDDWSETQKQGILDAMTWFVENRLH